MSRFSFVVYASKSVYERLKVIADVRKIKHADAFEEACEDWIKKNSKLMSTVLAVGLASIGVSLDSNYYYFVVEYIIMP